MRNICFQVETTAKTTTGFMAIIKSEQVKKLGEAAKKMHEVKEWLDKLKKEIKVTTSHQRKVLPETVTRLALEAGSIADPTGIAKAVGWWVVGVSSGGRIPINNTRPLTGRGVHISEV